MQRAVFVLVLALCASIAAGQLAFKRPTQDCVAPALSTFVDVDLFPEPYRIQALSQPQVSADKLATTVDVASDFTVTYYPTYKVVTNTRKNETYLLYQCGTPNPATAEAGAKVPGLPAAGFKTFQIPLVATAVSDTTVNGFLRQLGVLDRVAYAAQLSVDPCLQKVSGCGNTTADEWNPKNTPEQLKAAQTTQAAATDSIWVFDKDPANPESIAFSATADPGTLARAEWIKFVAPFFNKEVEANQVFANISAAYNATKAAAAKEVGATKKKVAWVAWSSYAGPGVVVYLTPYKSQYITDAGGVPLTVDEVNATAGIKPDAYSPTTNFAINYTATPTADLVDLLKTVDVIIDETYNLTDLAQWKEYFKLPATGATGVPAVDAKQVYSIAGKRGADVDGSYGNDWFEGAVANPDVVLADFASILAPASVANHQPKYLLALDGVAEPNVTTAAACSLFPACASRGTPEAICPNVYKDCATGKMMQAKPEERCAASVVCADTVPISAPAPSPQPKNAGWRAAAASSLLAGLGGAAALLLLLAA